MKKIFLIGLIVLSLMAEDKNETKTALEMFLFKVGVTSLTEDFENEKKNISKNSSEIEKLKSDIKYLLQQNIKNKLVVKDDGDLVVDEDKSEDIKKLEDENAKLKEYIKKLENTKKKKSINEKITTSKKAIIYDEKASLKVSPYPNSKIVKYVYKDDTLDIQWCNKYGWCKIVNKNEYIAKYKIYFMEENK